jgi:hypothetical protein
MLSPADDAISGVVIAGAPSSVRRDERRREAMRT